jgi:uncharacterized protein YndB with AHSA1/START domain
MSAATREAVAASDREIVIRRVFDAPRPLVWKAFTEAKHIDRWWGPNGFRNATKSMDFRVGGAWRFTMHGPDGTDYRDRVVYREIVEPERMVYDHGSDIDDDPEAFEVTVTLNEVDGGTEVVLRSLFRTAAQCAAVKKFGAVEGGQQTLARLGGHLPSMDDAGARVFEVTRTFDAPRDLVWKAYTEAKRLAQWWGPKGFEMLRCSVDLRVGGMCLYGMKAPNGFEMWGKFIYRQIVPPDRLVFVVSFSDKDAATTRHFASPTWPLEVLNTLTLTELDGRTTVWLRGHPVNATAEERATFEAGFGSMEKGFAGTLDQLEAYLAAAQG